MTARLPFPDAVSQAALLQRQLSEPIPSIRGHRPELSAAVDEVIARATAKNPTDRYAQVEELIDAMAGLVKSDVAATAPRTGTTTARSGGLERNPFKGLRAFTEADAADFRGRERLVDRLVEMLARPDNTGRIVAVVGPSGIGKSSVVRAGLLPALRGGRVAGSDRWFIATMTPGTDPFGELAAALLRVAAHTPDNLMSLLTDDERGIARLVKVLVPDGSDEEIVLVVDQFEEIFTLAADTAQRRFLDGVAHAVTDARCPLRVVLTMRADFWDRPLRHGVFARLIEQSTVHVTALAPDELERAITEPAHAVGCEFEPGLVPEIAADVADQPGALPLLQYALTELWEQRVSGLLTRDAYAASGGVAGALARRAEDLHETATADEQVALRRIFGQLVSFGEGTEDTRRRVLVSDVSTSWSSEQVLAKYGDARLLSFDIDPATREPTAEMAHEALIREWPRLRTWLDEDRDDLRIQRHLKAAAEEWEASGRDPGELYRGGRLEAVEEYLARRPQSLPGAQQEFVDVSVTCQQDVVAAERRVARRLRVLLTGAAVVAVVALVAGLVAFQQRDQAAEARDEARAQAELASAREKDASAAQQVAEQVAFEAETRRLIADAATLVETNPDVALLLAAEAHRRSPGPQSLGGLQAVLASTGPYLGAIGRDETFLAADWLDDGTIVGLTETALQLYDGDTRALVGEHQLPAPVAKNLEWRVAFDTSGALAVAGLADGSVLVVRNGGEEGGTAEVLRATAASVSAVALSGDGGLLAVGDWDGAVMMIELSSGEQRWRVTALSERGYADVMDPEDLAQASFLRSLDEVIFRRGPADVAFEPTGAVVVAAGPHVRRLDGGDGSLVAEALLVSRFSPALPPVPRGVTSLHPNEDGSLTAVAGSNGYFILDPEFLEREVAFVPTGRAGGNIVATSVSFDSDNEPWFGLSNGQLVRGVGDTPAAEAVRLVTGLANLRSLARSADGGQFLVAGRGGLEFWSADGRQLLAKSAPHGGNNELFVAPDGQLAVASSIDSSLRSQVLKLSGERFVPVATPEVAGARAFRILPDPDSRFVVALASSAGDVTLLLDRETGVIVGEGVSGTVPTLSDEGDLIAWGLPGGLVGLYTFPAFEQVGPLIDESERLADEADFINQVDLDADGKRLLISFFSGTTLLYDVEARTVLAFITPGEGTEAASGQDVVAARFVPGTDLIVTRGRTGAVTLRDSTLSEVVGQLPPGPSPQRVSAPART